MALAKIKGKLSAVQGQFHALYGAIRLGTLDAGQVLGSWATVWLVPRYHRALLSWRQLPVE